MLDAAVPHADRGVGVEHHDALVHIFQDHRQQRALFRDFAFARGQRRDVGVRQDDAAVGRVAAAPLDHPAVLEPARENSSRLALDRLDPRLGQGDGIAVAELTLPGKLLHHLGHRHADAQECRRKIVMFDQPFVPHAHVAVGVEHHDALIHALQRCRQKRALFGDLAFALPRLGDVGIGDHHAAVGQRSAAALDRTAAEIVGRERGRVALARILEARHGGGAVAAGGQALRPAHRVDQFGHGHADAADAFGNLHQLEHAAVPQCDAHVGVEHDHALIHVAERRREQLVLVLDALLLLLELGDVRIRPDHHAVRRPIGVMLDDAAVGADADAGVVAGAAAKQRQAPRRDFVDIAVAVFAELGGAAHQFVPDHAGTDHARPQPVHLEEALVPHDDAGLGVVDQNALMHVVERRLQQRRFLRQVGFALLQGGDVGFGDGIGRPLVEHDRRFVARPRQRRQLNQAPVDSGPGVNQGLDPHRPAGHGAVEQATALGAVGEMADEVAGGALRLPGRREIAPRRVVLKQDRAFMVEQRRQDDRHRWRSRTRRRSFRG